MVTSLEPSLLASNPPGRDITISNKFERQGCRGSMHMQQPTRAAGGEQGQYAKNLKKGSRRFREISQYINKNADKFQYFCKILEKSLINPSTDYRWEISCRFAPKTDISEIFCQKIPTFQSMEWMGV